MLKSGSKLSFCNGLDLSILFCVVLHFLRRPVAEVPWPSHEQQRTSIPEDFGWTEGRNIRLPAADGAEPSTFAHAAAVLKEIRDYTTKVGN
jgi:hypothetical protein